MTEEDRIQASFVRWFHYQHPRLKKMLFAVPNGGARSKATAGILKATGVVAGVADLILLVGNKDYNSLCIETKTQKGTQTQNQKAWQKEATQFCNKYVICRTLDDFIREVNSYLGV